MIPSDNIKDVLAENLVVLKNIVNAIRLACYVETFANASTVKIMNL